MASLLIKNTTVITIDSQLTGMNVLAVDGVIKEIAGTDEISERNADDIVDGSGYLLAPGYIDMHIHGVLEYLVDSGKEDIEKMSEVLPRYGVTSFLPSISPLPENKEEAFLSPLSTVQTAGSQILGYFVEGPFLSLTGALPPDAIGKPNRERIRAIRNALSPYPVVFAVAPDVENITEVIPEMARDNQPVFMTHTAANVEQTEAAIAAGVSHATHFYDVYPCPEEADPGARPCGAVEAVLADPGVTVDFILDGEHVHPVAVRMALQCKGPGGVSLITDANIGAGLPPGVYSGLGGSEVRFAYEGGPARMTENSRYPGCLAGSGLTLDKAVKNAVKFLSLEVPQAVRMATANPAKVLHLEHRKGEVKEGYDADLVLLDHDLNIKRTWAKGKEAYKKGK